MEDSELMEINFEALRRKHNTDGFRDGVNAGKEYILQTSFNHGFQVGINTFKPIAYYRGCLSAILLWLMSEKSYSEELRKKVENLITKFEELESRENNIEEITLKVMTDEKKTIQPVKSERKISDNELNDLVDMMKGTTTTTMINDLEICSENVDKKCESSCACEMEETMENNIQTSDTLVCIEDEFQTLHEKMKLMLCDLPDHLRENIVKLRL